MALFTGTVAMLPAARSRDIVGTNLSPSRYSVSFVAVSESPGNRDVMIIVIKNYPVTKRGSS